MTITIRKQKDGALVLDIVKIDNPQATEGVKYSRDSYVFDKSKIRQLTGAFANKEFEKLNTLTQKKLQELIDGKKFKGDGNFTIFKIDKGTPK